MTSQAPARLTLCVVWALPWGRTEGKDVSAPPSGAFRDLLYAGSSPLINELCCRCQRRNAFRRLSSSSRCQSSPCPTPVDSAHPFESYFRQQPTHPTRFSFPLSTVRTTSRQHTLSVHGSTLSYRHSFGIHSSTNSQQYEFTPARFYAGTPSLQPLSHPLLEVITNPAFESSIARLQHTSTALESSTA